MSGIQRFVGITLCLLVTCGCSSATISVIQALEQPLARVSLSLEESSDKGTRDVKGFHAILRERLSAADVAVLPAKGDDVYHVQGTLAQLDPGIRWKRMLFGTGRGFLDSTWKVLDAQGKRVGACRIQGTITTGYFGGSFDTVLKRAA
ncbi:MAG: hypothetical protein V3T77_07685, partial [Planctomycetota bacterium]